MPSETTGATGLSGRYATALFELADDEKALDTTATDLVALGSLIGESRDLAELIRSPVVSREDQGRAMAAILYKAGMSPLTQRFVGVVAENGRLSALPAMISAYQTLLAEHRGQISAEVVSAQALNEKQLNTIKDSLKKAMGSQVAVDAHVDPGLLGGLIVKVGSRMIDSSLRTKLQRLRLAMRGT